MSEPERSPMHWVSALSTRPSLEAAIAEVVQQAQAALPAPATVGFVFISSAFASDYSRLMPLFAEHLPGVPLLGCSGGGVVGTAVGGQTRELEDKPALSLTLAVLPGVQVHPFHLQAEALPDLDSAPDAWIDLVGVSPACQPQFVLLADPFSARITDLLQGLDYAYPQATKVGGLASMGATNGAPGLFCHDRLYREGSVGLALSGNLVLDAIVAQGCRPIGQPCQVVEGERNVVMAVEEARDDLAAVGGGSRVSHKRTPLEVLQDTLQALSSEDRRLAETSLFVGIAQNEFKQTLEPGDFLIRQLLGVDPRVGAIAIGDRIRPGQRIQFHLRDAETSAEDLDLLLERYQRQVDTAPAPIGALMFACLGRGEGLYGEPNFDSRLFGRYFAAVPLSGFFCNGEIGPVSSNTFLHGFTSVFGIFRQP